MKRLVPPKPRAIIPGEEIYSLNALPREIKELILIQFHHTVSNANTISKLWYFLILNYRNWFDVAYTRYKECDIAWSIGDCRDVFETIIHSEALSKRLQSPVDQKCLLFKMYVGMTMNARYRKIVDFKSSLLPGSTGRPFPLLHSMAEYIRENKENILALRNFHPSDFYINFKEAGHKYSLMVRNDDDKGGFKEIYSNMEQSDEADSVTNDINTIPEIMDMIMSGPRFRLLSATGFKGTLFPKFNPYNAIDFMKSKVEDWKDPVKNQYYGMTDEEIIEKWRLDGETASVYGTAGHLNIERYYNGLPFTTDKPEFALFRQFENDHVHKKLVPWRTEHSIKSEYLQLCGQADMLYERINDTLHSTRDCIIIPEHRKKRLKLYDWKFCKEIPDFNTWPENNSGCQPCTYHAPNCKFIEYLIQLGVYKEIYEREYDVIIDESVLVQLHPSQTRYKLIPINWDRHSLTFIKDIIQHRIDTIYPHLKKVESSLAPFVL